MRELIEVKTTIFATAICLAFSSACTTIKSELQPSASFSTTVSDGFSYFLPQKFVTIQVATETLDLAKMKTALGKLETSQKTNKAAEAKKKAEVKALTQTLANLTAADAGYAPTAQALSRATAELKVLEAASKRLAAAISLLKSDIRSVLFTSTKCKFKVSTKVSESYPDPTMRMVAKFKHSPLRDDTYEIKVSKNGLLSSADVEADDQLGAIVTEVAGAVGGFSGASLNFEMADGQDKDKPDAKPCASYKPFKYMFDPLETEHQHRLEEYLEPYPLRVRFDHLGSQFTTVSASRASTGTINNIVVPNESTPSIAQFNGTLSPASRLLPSGANSNAPGLFYRSSAPILMTIEQASISATRAIQDNAGTGTNRQGGNPAQAAPNAQNGESAGGSGASGGETETDQIPDDDFNQSFDPEAAPKAGGVKTIYEFRDWRPVEAAVIMLPQAGPVNYVPYKSSAFVKTVDEAEFADGELRSWKAERPSEVLEVVRLPVKILKALVSVPAELISFKVDYSSSEEKIAASQATILQQEEINDAYLQCLISAGDDLTAIAECGAALSGGAE